MNVFLPKLEFNPLLAKIRDHDLPFVLEKDKWHFVDDIGIADIVPTLTGDTVIENLCYGVEGKLQYIGQLTNQYIVIMMHTHAWDAETETLYRKMVEDFYPATRNVVIVSLNKNIKDQIYYDFCWNRQKLYFTEYDRYDLRERMWVMLNATKKMFSLEPIELEAATKKFLIPNRIYGDNDFKRHVRQRLRQECNNEDCFFSSPTEGLLLSPNEDTPEVLKHFDGSGGWNPIHNFYYQNSIVSAYVETTVSSKFGVRCISEKTFDPLIKGHFILPMAYAGIINDLKKDYGFIFPDWIDYSYDEYIDDQEREYHYFQSFQKIRNTDINVLAELYNRDKYILEHNRQLFYDRPYDSLYEKIKVFCGNKK